MCPLQQNTASEFDEADLKNDQVIFEKPVHARSRINIYIYTHTHTHTHTYIYMYGMII